MRVVVVNHCPPTMAHVCATRAREFSRALAKRGHQVVILAEAEPGLDQVSPNDLDRLLAAHDWSNPLTLTTFPSRHSLVRRARRGELAAPLRRLVLAWSYWRHRGVLTDWSLPARPLAVALGRTFLPDAVWGVFGNSDCWTLAQTVARTAGCRWVADVKDPLGVFLPLPFRRRVLAGFADTGAITALSDAHAHDVLRWWGRSAHVVYSGIDRDFWGSAVLPPPIGPLRVLLVGSTYDRQRLNAMVEGIRGHATTHPGTTLVYAGNDSKLVAAAAAALADCARVECLGFLTLAELRRQMELASILVYLRQPAALYQHKLPELLSVGRPIVTMPGETAEAQAMAGAVGGLLLGAEDARQMTAILDDIARTRPFPAPEPEALRRLSWDALADTLLRVLERTE